MARWFWVAVTVLAAVAAAAVGAPVEVAADAAASSLEEAHNETVMSSVCVDMNPTHGNSTAQAADPPYAIYLLQKKANPFNSVQINMYGKGGEQFKGVYVQGRYQGAPVGQFVPPGAKSPPVTISNCPPGQQNAASYISRKPITQLNLEYIVPDVPEIVFTATFVKSYSEYWTGVKSDRLVVVKPQDLEYE